MDDQARKRCYTLDERKTLFEFFGGLPATILLDGAWRSMLEEETRESLAIEGYFATEREIRAALQGRKSFPEILNYYRTAQTVYDQALQYYRDTEICVDVPVVCHVHSELFRELDKRRGEFRKDGMQIHGAKAHPPEFDVDTYIYEHFCG